MDIDEANHHCLIAHKVIRVGAVFLCDWRLPPLRTRFARQNSLVQPNYDQSTANNFLKFLRMVAKALLMRLMFINISASLLAVGNNIFASRRLFQLCCISPKSLYYNAAITAA